jgi:hypothetical protein
MSAAYFLGLLRPDVPDVRPVFAIFAEKNPTTEGHVFMFEVFHVGMSSDFRENVATLERHIKRDARFVLVSSPGSSRQAWRLATKAEYLDNRKNALLS